VSLEDALGGIFVVVQWNCFPSENDVYSGTEVVDNLRLSDPVHDAASGFG
jgi:hypothetical protein